MVRRNFLRSIGAVFAFLTVDSASSRSHNQPPQPQSAPKADKSRVYAFKADVNNPEALQKKLRELSSKYFEEGRIVKIKRVSIKNSPASPESTLKVFTFNTPEDKAQYISERTAVVSAFEALKKTPIA